MDKYTWNITLSDLIIAIKKSDVRMLESYKKNLGDQSVPRRSLIGSIEEELVGMLGEMAVANIFNDLGPKDNTFYDEADIGGKEVRATTRPDGCLIIRPKDVKTRRYILAIVDRYKVKLAGWILGSDGMRDEYIKSPYNRDPAWFIPQHKLNTMESF